MRFSALCILTLAFFEPGIAAPLDLEDADQTYSSNVDNVSPSKPKEELKPVAPLILERNQERPHTETLIRYVMKDGIPVKTEIIDANTNIDHPVIPQHVQDLDSTSTNGEDKKIPNLPKPAELDVGIRKPDILQQEILAKAFMKDFNNKESLAANEAKLAAWGYQTNLTNLNKDISIEASKKYAEQIKKRHKDIKIWNEIVPQMADKSLVRQFKLYSILGEEILSADKYAELTRLSTEMQEIYSTAEICDYKNSLKCDLSINPDISSILKSSRDYDELTYVWKAWRDASGKKMRKLFEESVKLKNEAAVLNGFESSAEMWTENYEDENIDKDLANLFEELRPLYNQLHAYARRKLREVYGEDKISKNGTIPAHLLGNMWSQSWEGIYDILIPYPEKTSVDVTDAMIEQGYTPRLMFEKSDDFFASLGLKRVSDSFWKNSLIVKPKDRKVVCHASAWDFNDGKDFRIKQCTEVTMKDFFTVHHEMGHIQYAMQYNHLPSVFRRGANAGFHEAVGDLMSLSVSTPKHLKQIGLIKNYTRDHESDINFLMSSALTAVPFLPFGYLIDQWRWDVFRGLVTPENYTCTWWDYRYRYQGIKAPVQRSELDFDPAAKFHVAAHSKYIQYFVSRILTFHFHKRACTLANEYEEGNPDKPMHKCDIHDSKEAGKAIGDMLSLGGSQHWRKTLESFTGTPNMTVKPLLEYFKPLMDWLKKDNEKHNEFIGWQGENDFCS